MKETRAHRSHHPPGTQCGAATGVWGSLEGSIFHLRAFPAEAVHRWLGGRGGQTGLIFPGLGPSRSTQKWPPRDEKRHAGSQSLLGASTSAPQIWISSLTSLSHVSPLPRGDARRPACCRNQSGQGKSLSYAKCSLSSCSLLRAGVRVNGAFMALSETHASHGLCIPSPILLPREGQTELLLLQGTQ